ncbi:MAG: Ig-like domain-containing protein [Armatimonadetes bacterium]|nr:Ig-like domain-containing protein [Candidatus Hippobium faecium]
MFNYEPLSSEFLDWFYKQQLESFGLSLGSETIYTTGGKILNRAYKGGVIPEPYTYPNAVPAKTKDLVGGMVDIIIDNLSIPSAYDSRNYGFVTPVRQQSPWGTCWAHASIHSMESSYLIENGLSSDMVSFSPLNLAWKCRSDIPDYEDVDADTIDRVLNSGGNSANATTYLKNLTGPVWEADDPYVDPYTTKNRQPEKAAAIMGSYNLITSHGQFSDEQKIKIVKAYIMRYGAAYISYNSADTGYLAKDDLETFYYPENSGNNHAVTLVGWDDEFDNANFMYDPKDYVPEGVEPKGAWLCKNSWHSSWGAMGGYFWISYHEPSLNQITGLQVTSATNDYKTKITPGGKNLGVARGFSADMTVTKSTPGYYGYIERVGAQLSSGSEGFTAKIYINDELVATENFSFNISSPNADVNAMLFAYSNGGYFVGKLKNHIRFTPEDEIALELTSGTKGSQYPMTCVNIDPVEGVAFAKTEGAEDWTDIGKTGAASSGTLYCSDYTLAEKVQISEDELVLTAGESHQITGKTLPVNCSEPKLYFTSSDKEIAVVDADGNIKGLQQGECDIDVANIDGVNATCHVKVYDPCELLKVNYDEYTLTVGEEESFQIVPTVHPRRTLQECTYTADNTSIKVDENGVVSIARARAGKNVVTVSPKVKDTNLEKVYKKVIVNVIVPVTGIDVTPSSCEMNLNDTKKLTASVHPSTASVVDINWSSLDETVATVDNNGNVTAVGLGKTVITAETVDGGFVDTCTVKVSAKPTGIVAEDDFFMNTGSTHKLIYKLLPSFIEEQYKDVTFKSSNTAVASVNSSGIVTAMSTGIANITVTTKTNGFSATCKVTVREVSVYSVSLDKKSLSMSVYDTEKLNATIKPESAKIKSLNWFSSDDSVATVDGNGVVTAVNEGVAVITVITVDGGKTAECVVKVSKTPVSYVDIFDYAEIMKPGDTYQFQAKAYPESATFTEIEWSSLNENIATVDENGVVTAVMDGVCEIMARADDKFKTVLLTVQSDIMPEFIEADPASIIMKAGTTTTLNIKVYPFGVSQNVEYKSFNNDVATVNNRGKINAVSTGTTIIRVTSADDPSVYTDVKITVRR